MHKRWKLPLEFIQKFSTELQKQIEENGTEEEAWEITETKISEAANQAVGKRKVNIMNKKQQALIQKTTKRSKDTLKQETKSNQTYDKSSRHMGTTCRKKWKENYTELNERYEKQ